MKWLVIRQTLDEDRYWWFTCNINKRVFVQLPSYNCYEEEKLIFSFWFLLFAGLQRNTFNLGAYLFWDRELTGFFVCYSRAILFISLGLSKTENVTGESRASPEILICPYVVIDDNFKLKRVIFSFFCFSFCCFPSFTSLVSRSDKLLQCVILALIRFYFQNCEIILFFYF